MNKVTRKAILNLKILVEKQIELSQDTFIVFIDFEKTSIRYNGKIYFYTLEGIAANYRGKNIINNLYKDQPPTIKVTDKTEITIIRKGVKQEFPLSLTLFNIYVEQP
jgi:hypothetical protein